MASSWGGCVVLGDRDTFQATTAPTACMDSFGVVDIFVAGEAAVDRLPQQRRQGVLSVLPGAGVVQATGRGTGKSQGVVEFAVGKESGVTGDGRAMELQLDFAVEIDP